MNMIMRNSAIYPGASYNTRRFAAGITGYPRRIIGRKIEWSRWEPLKRNYLGETLFFRAKYGHTILWRNILP